MSVWKPLGWDPKRKALHEGVPVFMEIALYGWINQTVERAVQGDQQTRQLLLADFDMRAELSKPLAPGSVGYYVGAVLMQRKDTTLTIQFVDYFVHLLTDTHFADALDELEAILERGSSVWTVGRRLEYGGLIRRVPEGVQEAVEGVIATSASAGELLKEAWIALYGRMPDYEEAYEKAIKAVEEAGAEKVAAKNKRGTLGIMARDMEAQKTWRLELIENPQVPTNDVVTKMVRSLWEGQESRHGGNGYRKPTRGEAEAAVLLAVPLVLWFTSGAIARR